MNLNLKIVLTCIRPNFIRATVTLPVLAVFQIFEKESSSIGVENASKIQSCRVRNKCLNLLRHLLLKLQIVYGILGFQK